MSREQAYICDDCGMGSRAENCVKCGKWCASNKIPAFICNNCGFGNKAQNCVKCGKRCP